MEDLSAKNLTALNEIITSHWQSSPSTRGTADILYSCLVTITACVYTAIHLNIPAPGESQSRQTLRQVRWVVIGIFAPEVVLLASWYQYRQAKKLVDLVHKFTPEYANSSSISINDRCRAWIGWQHRDGQSLRPKDEESKSDGKSSSVVESTQPIDDITASHVVDGTDTEESRRTGKLGLAFGFYAVMGGFRTNCSDLSDQDEWLILSVRLLAMIVRKGGTQYLYVDPATIEDRSKANNLAKTLVCLQVSWMAIQCISRKAAGLPLTLLELHVFAHVLCAFGIYMFWFNKPLDVKESTIIDMHKISAQLRLDPNDAHEGSDEENSNSTESRSFSGGMLAWSLSWRGSRHWKLEIQRNCCSRTLRFTLKESTLAIGRRNNVQVEQMWRPHEAGLRTLLVTARVVERHPRFASKAKIVRALYNGDEYVTVHIVDSSCHCPEKVDIFKFKLSLSRQDKLRMSYLTSHDRFAEFADLFYRDRQTNLAYREDLFTFNKPLLGLGFILTVAYAGIHAAAWNWNFASLVERRLWQCASSFLPTFVPVVTLCCWALDRWTSENGEGLSLKVAQGLACLFLMGFLPCYVALYAAGRIFLVLEALLSLRAVPIGVYVAIPWTQYLPHI